MYDNLSISNGLHRYTNFIQYTREYNLVFVSMIIIFLLDNCYFLTLIFHKYNIVKYAIMIVNLKCTNTA